MFTTILELLLISLIPICVTIAIILLNKFTKLNNVRGWKWHILIGLIFGGISILGTVLGVTTESGAVINIRDSAPICAGLIFGGPAGIIAGFIGGIYRFVCVYWGGAGAYTQWACAIATILSGVIAALVRKFIFNNHHGRWFYGLALGVLCESLHLLLVFFTNMNDIEGAYNVVSLCAIPMIVVNGLTVMVSSIAAAIVSKEKLINFEKPRKLAVTVQAILAVSLLGAYLSVSLFSYFSLKNTSDKNVSDVLITNVNDIKANVVNEIDNEFGNETKTIRDSFETDVLDNSNDIQTTIDGYLTTFNISEVNVVDKDNIIVYTTNPINVNFDMTSDEQSNAFTCLNNGTELKIQSYMPMANDPSTKMKYAGAVLKENTQNFGYIQFGYNEEMYHSLLNDRASFAAANRHVGEKGFVIICDESGRVVSKTNDSSISSTFDISRLKDDKKVTLKVGDLKYYVYTSVDEGFYISAFAECNEFDLSINIAFTGITLTEISVFLIIYFIIYVIIKRKVVDSITNIDNSLNEISNGDLNVKVNDRSHSEFDSLSNSINATVDTLKGFIEKEAQKIADELAFAKQIQLSALPNVIPESDDFKLFAYMETAKEVGGDFYDYYFVGPKKIVIQIADVSGKGIPAAMFMMKSKSVIKSLVESGKSLEEAYSLANAVLCDHNDAQMFVTAWVGLIDLETGHVEFVNAGHNPPLIRHAGGDFEYLQSKRGLVLAGLDCYKYKKQEFVLNPGDEIFLYTDGVTEATNSSLELYGEERLKNVCNSLNSLPKQFIEGVINDLNKFVNGSEQADDITMLSFKFKPKKNELYIEEKAEIPNIERIVNIVNEYLEKNSTNIKAINQVDVVIDELVSNICNYAYKDAEIGSVVVEAEIVDSLLIIKFIDNGVAFNPLENEDPDTMLDGMDRPIGGLGILLVKKTTDSVSYERKDNQNILVVTKKLN